MRSGGALATRRRRTPGVGRHTVARRVRWGAAIAGLALADPAAAEPALDPADLLSRAIQIPTENPPGNEAALAELLVATLREQGIAARVVPTPGLQGADPDAPSTRAAAWARVPGRGAARPIVLLSHLDVVGAEPTEWRLPPFDGVLSEGFVHGRGALDAKGVTVVHLATLVALARRETPLARDVIFLATPDEESGGLGGAGHLARERPDLLGDAEFLLTEGGGIRPATHDAPPIWGVTITEKSPCWLSLTARGTPGHSSAPGRDAAVPRLIAALDRIRRIETPIRVIPEVAEMFAAMAPLSGEPNHTGYADLGATLATDEAFRRRFLRNPGRAALVRDTLSITVLEGSPRTNVAPAEARAHLDVRLLPGGDCDAFRESLAELIDDDQIEIDTLLAFPARSSPSETDLFRAIRSAAQLTDSEARVVPRVIGGFTDAHWFRELGIVAYGFVPRRLAPEETGGVHGIDEKISIENLHYGVDTLVTILEELD